MRMHRPLTALVLAGAFLVVAAARPAGSSLSCVGYRSVYAQDDRETEPAGGDTDGWGDHEPDDMTASRFGCGVACKFLKVICITGSVSTRCHAA